MFGLSPSSLDAVMYGYLASLLKAPFPNNSLQNYLKACGNLVKFVVRISQNYFPNVVSANELWDREEKSSSGGGGGGSSEATGAEKAKKDDEEWPNETRNKLIAGVVATTAMAGYAYASGFVNMVNIDLGGGGGDDEEEEEEEAEYED